MHCGVGNSLIPSTEQLDSFTANVEVGKASVLELISSTRGSVKEGPAVDDDISDFLLTGSRKEFPSLKKLAFEGVTHVYICIDFLHNLANSDLARLSSYTGADT